MTKSSAWRVVQTGSAIVTYALFLTSVFIPAAVPSILHPVPLFLALAATMHPFRGEKGHSWLLGVAGVITFVTLLATTGTLLTPFVLALVLAYVLDPLVDRLEDRRVPRSVAIVVLMLPATGLLALVLAVLLPSAIRQLGGVLQDIPALIDHLRTGAAALLARDLPLIDESALLARLEAVDGDAVTAFLSERQEDLLRWLWTGVLGLGRGLGTLFTLVGFAALTPVLTYYTLRDWDRITEAAANLFPADRRGPALEFAKDCDRIISRYMRAQILVATIMGTLTGGLLAVFGFPYAATLGLVVGVFSLVPYLGMILGLLPAVIIALTTDSAGTSLLIVAGVYGGTQLLESAVIGPRIASESVGLHPVWVVLALSVGGFFFGFAGLLLAVPAAAVTRLVLVRALQRYQGTRLYQGASGE